MSYEISELERLITGVVKVGTVESVDYKAGECRVRVGDWVSTNLPWSTVSAGRVRTWSPPSVGEQAMILSPSGLPEGGFVLPGFYTDQHKNANDNRSEITAIDYPDGARQSYDHDRHEWILEVPDGGKIVIKIGETTLELRSDGTTLKTPAFKAEKS